ncbi:glycosyltransferase family 25 protein [Candidatus Vesicomyosocius okutanii]|uniref:glycosyltransferase family 25 protein n=1 Tax=Vesicomyosocius okutanii subsp. Calyptogena okutanii (strain HA) TaxID=412965 RepID=UPI00059B9B2D
MDKQLSKLETQFIQIKIIYNHQIQPKILQSYQQQLKYSAIYYTSFSIKEINCILNLYNTWKIVSNHNSKTYIVLENDIKIHSNFKNIIETICINLGKIL